MPHMEGKICIGAYNSFILHLLPKVMAEFIQQYPNIRIYVQEIVNENMKCFVTSDNAGIAMVAKNIGIFITAKLNSANLPENVVFREFEENFERKLGVAVKSLKNASPAVKKFYKMVTEIMAEESK